ncbi:MAG: hypothetical protein ACTHN3_10715 [Solirubrobacterales bacterium]
MTHHAEVDAAQEFIEELLRTGLALFDLLSSLVEELPEDAFPGEDSVEVLVAMVAGTCRPALLRAGESECRTATALIRTVWERVMADLRAAAALAGPQGSA